MINPKNLKRPNQKLEYSQNKIIEMEKCFNDFFYFCKYIKIVHPDEGKVVFKPRWYQKEILEKIIDNRFTVTLASRQVGKTTLVAAYILWYACFHSNKTIGVVSNKEKSAKDILKRIKGMYEELPHWIKPGVEIYNQLNIIFENDTEIMVSATSPDAFRGKTINVLLCDELGFVSQGMAEEFWASNYPTIAASSTSKIIVVSTPNGMYNLFHRIYSNAEKKLNTFIPSKYDYTVIPGRDEEWVKKEIANMGETKFLQEHCVKFLGSTNTVIDHKILEKLLSINESPIKTDLNDRLRVYEYPKNENKYFLGVDTAKGTGEHDSVVQVLKILSINPFKTEQVAVFQDNHTDVYVFSEIIFRTAIYYNNAHIMVENNAEGSTIVNKIWWDLEYENLVNESSKSTGLGIRATKVTKPKAVIAMKKLIENEDLIIRDSKTVDQLTTFIETSNNIFKGKEGKPDDLISALYWACYITNFDVFDEDIKIKTDLEDEEGWGDILSDIEYEVFDFFD